MVPMGPHTDLPKDCALVEIIHVHSCLRGALKALEKDVEELTSLARSQTITASSITSLERVVSERFQIIWSVFQDHSSAEDEFIWPALVPKSVAFASDTSSACSTSTASYGEFLEHESYEKDHVEELEMFSEINNCLTSLQKILGDSDVIDDQNAVIEIVNDLCKRIKNLSHHLHGHLQREESYCLPLVVKYMTREEISDLVGKIMGKRSADMVAKIMKMAVQNLSEAERLEMVEYLKDALSGTFFDRWLQMSGYLSVEEKSLVGIKLKRRGSFQDCTRPRKRQVIQSEVDNRKMEALKRPDPMPSLQDSPVLCKMIRAILANSALKPEEKSEIIQSLRASVLNSHQLSATTSLKYPDPYLSRSQKCSSKW